MYRCLSRVSLVRPLPRRPVAAEGTFRLLVSVDATYAAIAGDEEKKEVSKEESERERNERARGIFGRCRTHVALLSVEPRRTRRRG